MARLEARRKRLGQLEVLHIEASKDGPTVIMFHGFGADNEDLASLAGAVQAPKGTNWVFPNGHLTVPIGPHQEGRAWFPISIADLNKTAETGDALDWSATVPPGLKRARENALEMIDKLGVAPEKIVLAGFSQGGMLATEVALRMDKAPAGLAILSGTLINAPDWEARAKARPGFHFFQSHGMRDPVLSYAMAERLEKLLRGAGWQGKLQGFNGGHEIPSEVTIQLGAYLRQRLS
jgi:phospholipase/carboxylesterase